MRKSGRKALGIESTGGDAIEQSPITPLEFDAMTMDPLANRFNVQLKAGAVVKALVKTVAKTTTKSVNNRDARAMVKVVMQECRMATILVLPT